MQTYERGAMNTLQEAIARAKEKSDRGRSRQLNIFYNNPSSPNKLLRVFNKKFVECDFGNPPPVTKQVMGMLSGYIKLCRNNGWEEKSIYTTIESVVENWRFLRTQQITTMKNNKLAALGDRPSLLEFLICRDSMLSAIHSMKYRKEEPKKEEVKTVRAKLVKHGPSEEDLQSDFENDMESLF